jgi:light-regulated signal transduction histidine kinase (bacteriophytochrome)
LAHLFGVDQEWLVGRELERVLEEAGPRFLSPDITQQIASGPSDEHMTITMQNGQGPRIYDYNSIPISTERYEGGRIDYYHDITKNKQLEAELRQKTVHLSSANEKLEAFTHVVSHDLKEPLRTLEMFSAYVIEDYEEKLDEEGKDYLQSIARASRRMKGLIDGLLDLASIGRRNEPRETISIDGVIKDVLKDLEASLEGVDLRLPQAPFPDVDVNRTRIEQLFANLISNAVKYNDKTQKVVDVGWESGNGSEYVFHVKDNGIGIESEYVGGRIFELFERLNPHQDNYEGTGAGLAICKRIVEEYGGRIWAESEFGQGSAFYFTLPQPNTKVVNHHEAVEDFVG